ncbi:hypothetical protein HK104_000108 [Borealophlyctis nickersoniae]|nr:hypothetical protein HK104_000108 [Borealophlyctis nickersoniae]
MVSETAPIMCLPKRTHYTSSHARTGSDSTLCQHAAGDTTNNTNNPVPVIYQIRDARSKDKCTQFFGDHSIPMQVGKGSSMKLRNFLHGEGVERKKVERRRSLVGLGGKDEFSISATTTVLSENDGNKVVVAAMDGDRQSVVSVDSSVTVASGASGSVGGRRPSTIRWSMPSADPAGGFDGFRNAVNNANWSPTSGVSPTTIASETTLNDAIENAPAVASPVVPETPPTPSLLQSVLLSASSLPTNGNPTVRKLESIMGESCPVDVSVRDIEKNGLQSLLQSRLPLVYFLSFLLSEHNPEILFFLTDVSTFESTVFPTPTSLLQSAHAIFHTYLHPAPSSSSSSLNPTTIFEVNASHKARRAARDNIKQGANLKCFQPVVEEVLPCLEDAYRRFVGSAVWVSMKEDVGYSQITTPQMLQKASTRLGTVFSTHYSHEKEYTVQARQASMVKNKIERFLEGVGVDVNF